MAETLAMLPPVSSLAPSWVPEFHFVAAPWLKVAEMSPESNTFSVSWTDQVTWTPAYCIIQAGFSFLPKYYHLWSLDMAFALWYCFVICYSIRVPSYTPASYLIGKVLLHQWPANRLHQVHGEVMTACWSGLSKGEACSRALTSKTDLLSSAGCLPSFLKG